MKQLLNSSFVILCMLGLVVLGVLNTCQLNSLEEGVIANQKAIANLAESGIALQSSSSGSSQGHEKIVDQEEIEALRDPNNILKAYDRPQYNARSVNKGGTLRLILGQDPPSLNPYG